MREALNTWTSLAGRRGTVTAGHLSGDDGSFMRVNIVLLIQSWMYISAPCSAIPNAHGVYERLHFLSYDRFQMLPSDAFRRFLRTSGHCMRYRE